ncbi:MAG: acyl-CoA desaturase [Tepidisphaeraceae bacterium]
MLTPARKWASPADVPRDVAPPDGRYSHEKLVVFVTVVLPLLALPVGVYLLWNHGVTWLDLALMVVFYSFAGFGTTIGYHRLLTHRSFETSRFMRIFLTIGGAMGFQGPPVKWCAIHRRHHQSSDNEGDPHSPHLHGGGVRGVLRGLFHAHVGCLFMPDADDLSRSIPDLLQDRALMRVDRLYALWVALGLALPALLGGLITQSGWGAFTGFIWGGLVRVAVMDHVTWSVNSVCHVFGSRPFRSNDRSTNNLPVALLSLGEGWHNNHHAFPTSARHGLRWWQFDISYVLIRAMALAGLAWNVRVPGPEAMRAKRASAST